MKEGGCDWIIHSSRLGLIALRGTNEVLAFVMPSPLSTKIPVIIAVHKLEIGRYRTF